MDDDTAMAEAVEAARSVLPSRQRYAGVAEDLVAGLQKRDLKHESAVTQQLIDELGDALLPSHVFALTFEQAQLLTRRAMRGQRTDDDDDDDDDDDAAAYAQLERALDDFVRQRLGAAADDGGFFVKLSFMSAKDVALRPSNAATQRELAARLRLFWRQLPLVERLRAGLVARQRAVLAALLLDAFYAALRVRSAAEALASVCSSSRCFEELSEGLIDRRHFRTQIVVRPWLRIRPGFEFRVFVSNGRLTCASQYEAAHYPDVWRQRADLQRRIADFVRARVVPAVRHRLPSFVCDVVVTELDRLYVCELNPFASSTSACRFSWSADRRLLFVGPETWRFVPPPQRSEVQLIPPDWRDVIERQLRPCQWWTRCLVLVAIVVVGVALFALIGRN